MPICQHCRRDVAPREPYCSHCGKPRIADSLTDPAFEAPWINQAASIAALATLLLFVITVAVAFLREAQALRWGRAALAEDRNGRAYDLLQPYVAEHPDSLEGRYLAGIACLATNRPKAAAQHFGALESRKPTKHAIAKLEALRAAYGNILETKVAQLECGQTPIAGFYEAHEPLLEDFGGRILDGAARLASRCVGEEDLTVANEPGFWLIHERGMDPEEIVERLYARPAAAALERGETKAGRLLATQAIALHPESTEVLDPRFSALRRAFETHRDDLATLCREVVQELRKSQRYRGCLPPTAPTAVTAFRDPWGRGVRYLADGNGSTGCPRSFTLSSWSPESEPEAGQTESSTPTLRLLYRSGSWDCRWTVAQEFWRARP